jgi:ATP-dependent exoDNAse (exonuclease V) beta subunit
MNGDQSRLDQDKQAREDALKHRSFIVEAPAGSGKTELLTQRYLSLLATVDSPEEIIAITFTNKAASEMKKRILDSFSISEDEVQPHKIKTRQLAQTVLARSQDLGWNLLQTPSRLRIYTIDSLSGHLARQMPLLSRFGSQPAVCEDASLHYQEAVNRTLANLDNDAYSATVQAALRYFDNDHYKLTKLLAEMLEKRDQWLPYEKPQDSVALAEAAFTYLIAQEMRTLPMIFTDRLQQSLMPIACYAASNAILEYGEDHPLAILDGWHDPVRLVPQDLPKWYAIAYLLLKAEDEFRDQVDKRNGFPAGNHGAEMKTAHKDFINELRQIPEAESTLVKLRKFPYPRYEVESWEIVGTIANLLKLAVAELWLVFQQHGEVDFVEISKQALFALKDAEENPTDLALKLDYKIQHLLVDEFQDTSPTQIKLIEALTQGWGGDGRTLFAVGDPMQSIYRFRKANVSLFLRAATHGVGNVRLTPLKLWINNRSERPLIDWINRTFKEVFPEEDSVSRGAISYRECVPKHEGRGEGWTMHAMVDRTKVDVPDEDDEQELLQDELGQQEAKKIIQIIQETWAEDPKRKIAVLVRVRSHLHALVAEIRRKHPKLCFQAVEIEALANRQVVQDLLSLTYALHQRADRVHWLAILRAPWCGLTLRDMHALVGQDKYSTIHSLMHDERRLADLTQDGRQRLLHLRAVVDEALSNRGRMPTSRWVQSAWLMLGGPKCLWDAGDVRDVQAFFDRIDRMEAMGQFRLELLTQEIQKFYAAPDAQALDLLQFMTIHKSKGLEFDTVILPGLGKKPRGSDKPILIWEEVPKEEGSADVADVDLVVAPLPPKAQHKKTQPTPYAYLQSLEKERATHEDRRVLYVAATRAERHLHLLGTVKLNKDNQLNPTKNTFLEILWPIVSEEFEAVAESSPQEPEGAGLASAKLEEFIPKLVRLANPAIPEVLGGELPPSEATMSNQDEEVVALKPSIESSIGTLTHRYLELIATHGLDAWTHDQIASLKPVMRHWLTQQGHALEVASDGADKVAFLLQTTLKSGDGQWVLQPRAQSGQEQEILFMDNTLVKKRIIDRTFVDAGTRWIVDYKTTATVANASDAELQAEVTKYAPQLAEYASLFKDEGLPIKTAVLFVSIGRLIEVSV